MTLGLDVDAARELVEAFLPGMEPPGEDVWVITTVEERDWGCIISWNTSRAAMGSKESRDLYAGGGPFLVDRKTGRVRGAAPLSRRTITLMLGAGPSSLISPAQRSPSRL